MHVRSARPFSHKITGVEDATNVDLAKSFVEYIEATNALPTGHEQCYVSTAYRMSPTGVDAFGDGDNSFSQQQVRVRFDHIVVLLLRLSHHFDRAAGVLVPEAPWQRAALGSGSSSVTCRSDGDASLLGATASTRRESPKSRSNTNTPKARALLAKIKDLVANVRAQSDVTRVA